MKMKVSRVIVNYVTMSKTQDCNQTHLPGIEPYQTEKIKKEKSNFINIPTYFIDIKLNLKPFNKKDIKLNGYPKF